MLIRSDDGTAEIRFERRGSEEYSSYLVEIRIDIEHGLFIARNNDLQFLNLDAFLTALEKFMVDRTTQPVLEGTYGSLFRLRAHGQGLILEYRLGDAYCVKPMLEYAHTGGLLLGPGMADFLLREFRQLPVAPTE